jgi:hypothetical protein
MISVGAKKRRSINQRAMRDIKRQLVLRYRKNKCCVKCNDKGSSALGLEFHHRIPKDKTRTISAAVNKGHGLKLLVLEIRKCVLVCRDCHVETHRFLRIFEVC